MVTDVMRCHGGDNSVLLWAIKALANMTIDGEQAWAFVFYKFQNIAGLDFVLMSLNHFCLHRGAMW